MGMEELATAGAIAALLVGIHAVFAVYLYRILSAEREKAETPAEAVRMGSTMVEEMPASESRSDSKQGSEPSTVPCPVCGTQNNPSYQFCRQCVSDLSSGSVPVNSSINGSSW